MLRDPERDKPLVLCVDDDAGVRNAIRDMVEIDGRIDVFFAKNSDEGLRSVAAVKFDVILLDYALPDYDGPALLKLIRKIDKKVPVIFVSAYGGMEHQLSAYKAGGTAYIVKPFELEKLVDTTLGAIGVLPNEDDSAG